MLKQYPGLLHIPLQSGAGYAQPSQRVPERVSLDDPALHVMTDFRLVTAVVILPGDMLSEAHRRMIRRGVRLLLVVDQDRKVLGTLTASDILGEKPLQLVAHRGIRREELLVRDVMTPPEHLEVLKLDDVRSARVGHIVSTLRKAARHHAMVVEVDTGGRQTVRGLFSATQIARQLGVLIPTGEEIAQTFSEIEAQLAH
jgi:CBS domain-containing protein